MNMMRRNGRYKKKSQNELSELKNIVLEVNSTLKTADEQKIKCYRKLKNREESMKRKADFKDQ